MWSTLKVSDSSGSSSPSLVSYSPRITEILLSLARWTQWAAVAMYQWLSSTPPHWGELEDEERNKEKYCVSGEISQRTKTAYLHCSALSFNWHHIHRDTRLRVDWVEDTARVVTW